jgi:hypothetical protein
MVLRSEFLELFHIIFLLHLNNNSTKRLNVNVVQYFPTF